MSEEPASDVAISDGDLFEGHRTMDVEVTSNAADGATVDVNGTQLLIKQRDRSLPVLAEIWIEDEQVPIGSINTAHGETVTLGGVTESLANRVDEIAELPVEEVPAALDELAYRLNPSSREPSTDAEDPFTGGDIR